MEFILMLTRQDQTIQDARQVLDMAVETGVRRIGFKDVGASRHELRALAETIREAGATSYMEVVSTTSDRVRQSLATAQEIGVDCVLGGQDLDLARDVLDGGLAGYYPFPGKPHGHPTALGGAPEDVARDCRAYVEAGCAGVDLLAFRATDADPLELVRAARASLADRELIVAGSIASIERISALAEAGADAFTIGSAIFNGSFSPTKGSFFSQVQDALEACANAPRRA
ncbi:MAG: hypothetical protein MAG794_00408 [Gammaproteobacteria bacterium]|nr:hypothetical protein [Gammaproteobacteria bacterium]